MMNTKPKSEVSTRSGNTLTKLLIAVLLFSSACSSTYQTRSSDDDDIYYSAKDAPMDDEINYSTPAEPDNYTYQYDDSEIEGSERNTQAPDSTSEEYYEKDGNTYITNNYYSDDNYAFDYDDYYDYAYASRLRRFHSPVYGYGYYNSYYTNSYWYDYNPFNWGVSIYLGYPWWGFGYSTYGWYSGYYGGYGHGYYGHGYGGYYGYGYGGYGYGGYGCGGSGYGGYGYGGYGGYYDGYYNPYYYNSYDATSYYYGPRTLTSSNGSIATQTLAQLYVKDKNNSGMNVLQDDKDKFNQQSSGQSFTPSKGVTNAGKPISGKGVQAAQDINTIKGQQSLSPVKNTDMKDKGVVFTGKPVNKPNPDKPAINKPIESKSESYSYPGYNKPVQEIKSKAHVSPGYSQPKQGVKSKSYSGSNDYYDREMKSKPNTQVKSKTPYTYSKPKSNQRVDKPKSYGKSDYGNQSNPKSNSHTNYSKPKSSTPSKSNYSNRGSSSSSPKRSYSSPKSSGQRGSSVGRTSSPSRSSSPSKSSSPSRNSKPRR